MGKISNKDVFVSKAMGVTNHQNKSYDYSQVEYKRSSVKVKIICAEHGPFWQSPNAHLRGYGCPACGGAECITDEYVDMRLSNRSMERLEPISGGNTKHHWRCLKDDCGYDWYAKPSQILNGNTGCPKCAGNLPITNVWVDTKLDGRHILRLEDVATSTVKILWMCTKFECGHTWSSIPYTIMAGGGCPKCAGTLKLTNNDIDLRIVGRALRRLDDVVNTTKGIRWLCTAPNCGYDWCTSPANIMQGTGCPKCAGRAVLTNEDVDTRIADRYIQRCGSIQGNSNKVLWRCLKDACGYEWLATPKSILHGSGCPSCANHGYNPSKPAVVYVYSINETYCGYGVTNNFKVRDTTHKNSFKNFGASAVLQAIFECSGMEAQRIERLLKNTFEITDTKVKGFRKEATYLRNLHRVLDFIHEQIKENHVHISEAKI